MMMRSYYLAFHFHNITSRHANILLPIFVSTWSRSKGEKYAPESEHIKITKASCTERMIVLPCRDFIPSSAQLFFTFLFYFEMALVPII